MRSGNLSLPLAATRLCNVVPRAFGQLFLQQVRVAVRGRSGGSRALLRPQRAFDQGLGFATATSAAADVLPELDLLDGPPHPIVSSALACPISIVAIHQQLAALLARFSHPPAVWWCARYVRSLRTCSSC